MTIEILSQYALLKISGDDAATFLQGQLSNDVMQLASTQKRGNWQLSGYCNPKGRLLALFYLWKAGDDYYALLDQSLVEAIQKRLRMFVMRSKVVVEHIACSSSLGFFSREHVEQIIVDQLGNANELALDTLQRSGVALFGDKAILAINQRFLLVSQTPMKGLPSSVVEQGENWLSADIQEGLPQVTENSAEVFIPQMLNLDLLDGINFKKGCYTGQEIVARMHYLGKLKQRMFVCDVIGNSANKKDVDTKAALPGDKIYLDTELAKSVGNLVCISANHTKALAVVRIEHQQSALYLNQHYKLSINPLQPYLELS